MKGEYLVFYDGVCGLCDRFVLFVLKRDEKKTFRFAPLQGKTAKKVLAHRPELIEDLNTVVFVEGYNTAAAAIYTESKAVFRILWLLGGWWKLLGWIGFLPFAPFNFCYRWVANHRQQLFSSSCLIPTSSDKDRFLD